MARIEAKVLSYKNGEYSNADFYYSADAYSPSWTLIRTVPATTGGMQSISIEYELPEGNIQAIRVNHRYVGHQSSCTGGAYDDVDDLAFIVGAGGRGEVMYLISK